MTRFSGRRLIRNFLLLVSKKNSKSTIAAAIMITALIRNWRRSAEFLIVAPTLEVANNAFGPASDMIAANEELAAFLHVKPNFRTIVHRKTNATLKVIAADNETVSGKKAVGVLIDELWLFGKRANAESMLREAIGGLASRPEGFVIYLSTQSDEIPAGVWKQKLHEFRDIRDGKRIDKKSLPILYEFPRGMLEDESYRDPQNFYITNPNLGASVDEEFLVDEYEKAHMNGAVSFAGFAAKHLNVEIGIGLRTDAWPGAEFWQRATDPELAALGHLQALDRLLERSEVVTVGIDGGGLDDLFGLAVLGREPAESLVEVTVDGQDQSSADEPLVGLVSCLVPRGRAGAQEIDRDQAEGVCGGWRADDCRGRAGGSWGRLQRLCGASTSAAYLAMWASIRPDSANSSM